MHNTHHLEEVVIQLVNEATGNHVARSTICRTLGLGMRPFGADGGTLLALIEERINQGDWFFSVNAKEFLGDRHSMASTPLRSLLADPRTPDLCKYVSIDNEREISIPIGVWAAEHFSALVETGIGVDLIMKHGEAGQLELTRIDVDARPVVAFTFGRSPELRDR